MRDADVLAAGRRRARERHPTSTSFQGAYMKGVRARLAGRSIDACPYPRNPRQGWRRVYRSVWQDGWRSLDPAD